MNINERILAPATIINEIDKSYLPTAIEQIGACVIGWTGKDSMGEVLVPTLIRSYGEYVKKFGNDPQSYVTQLVKNYLANGMESIYVIRLLYNENINENINVFTITVIDEDLNKHLFSVIHPCAKNITIDSVYIDNTQVAVNDEYIDQNEESIIDRIIKITFKNNTTTKRYTFTLNPTNVDYIGKTIPMDIDYSVKDYVFIYDIFTNYLNSILKSNKKIIGFRVGNDSIIDFKNRKYSRAYSPIVVSQLNNSGILKLFRIVAKAHGETMNRKIKIQISNIRTKDEVIGKDYGTFSIVVRDFNDTDREQVILEQFDGLTLDPNDNDYILKRIGDKHYEFVVENNEKKLVQVGDFDSKSDYIYIEPVTDLRLLSNDVLPCGVEFDNLPVAFEENEWGNIIIENNNVFKTYIVENQDDYVDSRVAFGFDFENDDNLFYCKPLTQSESGYISNSILSFNLLQCRLVKTDNAIEDLTDLPVQNRKFIFPVYDGFDGKLIFTPVLSGKDIIAKNTFGFDCEKYSSNGSAMYRDALDIIANQYQYDVKLIFTPGIISKYHSNVVNYAIDTCINRGGDCFYTFDAVNVDCKNIKDVIDEVSKYNTSYAATYFPSVLVYDADIDKNIWLPPSVVIAGVYSYNDKVSYEWYAPAGIDRGTLNVKDVYVTLNANEANQLYANRINPILRLAGYGIVVWGQKTLQVKQSALDRINVRRLLIKLKKFIASTTKYLVFEQNNAALWARFMNIAKPYFDDIMAKSGLYEYRIIMDSTTNTPDIIDRNIVYGKILIKPTRAAEYIVIDFTIMPTGAAFNV